MESDEQFLKLLGFNSKSELAEAVVNERTSYYYLDNVSPDKHLLRIKSVSSTLSQYLFSEKKLPKNLYQVLFTIFAQRTPSGTQSEREAKFLGYIEQLKAIQKKETNSSKRAGLYSELLQRMYTAEDIVIFSPYPPELVKEKHNKIFIQIRDYVDLVAKIILRMAHELRINKTSQINFHYYIPEKSDGEKLWESLFDHILRFLNENKEIEDSSYIIEFYFENGVIKEEKIKQSLIELNESGNLIIQNLREKMTGFSVILFDYLEGYTNHGLQEGNVRLNKFANEDVINFKRFDLDRIETNGQNVFASDCLQLNFQEMI
ncbi:MAG TPA: hypothetical protein PKD91_10735 [Bacteroidia bacterium]|nr:hypothetical protein [Bacteroidia bacterium]